MKIFIIGRPCSGRTTVAKELAKEEDTLYISAFDWVKATFRDKKDNESFDDFKRNLIEFISERLKINPILFIENIWDIVDINKKTKNFIIDGVLSPKDFVHLFDYSKDIAIFLNRTDGPDYIEGHDHIGVNVMRDYCLYLGSVGLLDKSRWLEFNFPLPGNPDDDFSKTLGQKNTVTITRSLNKTINLIKDAIWNLT